MASGGFGQPIGGFATGSPCTQEPQKIGSSNWKQN
jgi:hypothetical protein